MSCTALRYPNTWRCRGHDRVTQAPMDVDAGEHSRDEKMPGACRGSTSKSVRHGLSPPRKRRSPTSDTHVLTAWVGIESERRCAGASMVSLVVWLAHTLYTLCRSSSIPYFFFILLETRYMMPPPMYYQHHSIQADSRIGHRSQGVCLVAHFLEPGELPVADDVLHRLDTGHSNQQGHTNDRES